MIEVIALSGVCGVLGGLLIRARSQVKSLSAETLLLKHKLQDLKGRNGTLQEQVTFYKDEVRKAEQRLTLMPRSAPAPAPSVRVPKLTPTRAPQPEPIAPPASDSQTTMLMAAFATTQVMDEPSKPSTSGCGFITLDLDSRPTSCPAPAPTPDCSPSVDCSTSSSGD